MPEYLVEVYAPEPGAHEAARAAGGAVDHLRSIYVADDEVCLHLFAAPSRDAVRDALRRAAVAYDRIVEAEERDHTTERGST
jgi:hypothetical protein